MLFLMIYAFHMPLFIFISGYFAKRASLKKVINFLLLYLLFQTIFIVRANFVAKNPLFYIDYSLPYFHLWYLVSMVLWYSVAILINKFNLSANRKIVVLTFIIIISVSSRFFTAEITNMINIIFPNFQSYTFSYQRTLSFAVFFFLGFFMNQAYLVKIYSSLKRKLIISFATVIGLYIYIYYTSKFNNNTEKIFKGSYGLEILESSNLLMTITQVITTLLISIGLCYVVLNIIPNRISFLTTWGDNSLTIFLFHLFVCFVFQKVQGLLPQNQIVIFSVVLVTSFVTSYALSTQLFVRYTKILCNPYETSVKLMRYLKIL